MKFYIFNNRTNYLLIQNIKCVLAEIYQALMQAPEYLEANFRILPGHLPSKQGTCYLRYCKNGVYLKAVASEVQFNVSKI